MHRITNRWAFVALAFLILLPPEIQQRAWADTESPRVVFSSAASDAARDLTVGPGMNAAGMDLRGCEFVGQDLTEAVFDGCILRDARIRDCILRRASFREAVFRGSQVGDFALDGLDGADFTDAVINGIGSLSLNGQFFNTKYTLELSPEQLISTRSYKRKDLRQCMVHGAWKSPAFDFREAHLEHAVLANGDFTKCDFSGAHIHGVKFRNFTLAFEQIASTSDFRSGRLCIHLRGGGTNNAGLTGKWNFSGINLEGSDFWVRQPEKANFTDAQINGCTLRRGFTQAQLYSTRSYQEGNLTHVLWVRMDLSNCSFSGMNLSHCHFSRCKFAGASFQDTVITGTTFFTDSRTAESGRLTVDQIKSTWNYKNGRMAGVKLPDDLAKALNQEHE